MFFKALKSQDFKQEIYTTLCLGDENLYRRLSSSSLMYMKTFRDSEWIEIIQKQCSKEIQYDLKCF